MKPSEVTSVGNKGLLDEILPQVYPQLHRLAASFLRRERDTHTLQPTALVNEAYLRLVGQHNVDFANRSQVLGIAAQMMRRILSTHEEARSAAKRGGEFTIVCLQDTPEIFAVQPLPFSAVDEILNRLAALDERQAKVAELRIFGGMTVEETGEFLGISHATVSRDWSSAKLWLARELRGVKAAAHTRAD